MRPMQFVQGNLPAPAITEAVVEELVKRIIENVYPEIRRDGTLSVVVAEREDHFAVSIYTGRHSIYDRLQSLTLPLSNEMEKVGIPALIYPEVLETSPSQARTQAELAREKGFVTIVVPFLSRFFQEGEGVRRESAKEASQRILDDVRTVAPSARFAPRPVYAKRGETYLNIDVEEYAKASAHLPKHLTED